ncbi:hypothetical protein L211DRAFT_102115 [Terfezia boudieri ATCC MYA-4762]|uniref:Uncharacterized protein n=1 Tax=Terfezia boudieri ATCC MYA-4762 TaxID=1051890 RepID=A0A3N4LQL9_9PEZI|nr:hypothetical protein L211DRAFT_102115 [Terfezia boudieri ATCC MYA-4762]
MGCDSSNMTTPLEGPSQSLPDSAKLIIGNSYILRPAQFELDRCSGSFRAAGSSQLVTITGETNQPAINEYNGIKPAILIIPQERATAFTDPWGLTLAAREKIRPSRSEEPIFDPGYAPTILIICTHPSLIEHSISKVPCHLRIEIRPGAITSYQRGGWRNGFREYE